MKRFSKAAAVLAVIGVAGCGSVDDDDEPASGKAAKGPITVALVIPQSGVYAPLGEDMKAGWDLYLAQHGGKLGGAQVRTVVSDEGEGPDVGVPAVQKRLQGDTDVLVGIVNSATALGVADAVDKAKKVLVVANAGAGDITGASPYIWRTSFSNEQVSYAIGKELASTPDGKAGAFAIAADYAAGEEAIAGFKKGFEEGGGKLVGEAKSPFGTTQDFQPFLNRIRRSGAKATYAFYAGAEAVAFVKQYREFGLSRSVPLVGSGFLTEGGVLKAQGAAADGVRTSLHYSSELDNPANKEFAEAYTKAAGRPPTVYAVGAYDAALVLDRGLAESKGAAGEALSKALGGLTEISDSPRGPWKFAEQSPEQTMYLREVDGGVNRVVESLGTIPPNP